MSNATPTLRHAKKQGIGRRSAIFGVAGSAAVITSGIMRNVVARDDVEVRGSAASSVRLRQVARIPIRSGKPDGGAVQSIAWSPDARHLAVAFDWGARVAVFDSGSWREICQFSRAGLLRPSTLAFLSDSELVTFPTDMSSRSPSILTVYDSQNGQAIRHIGRAPSSIPEAAASLTVPWSRKFVAVLTSSTKPEVQVYEASTGKFLYRLPLAADLAPDVLASGPVDNLAVAVSFRGARAEQYERNPIDLFDVDKNALMGALPGHVPHVHSLSWSPNGRLIASGSFMLVRNSTGKLVRDPDPIRIWDVATAKLARSFTGLYDPIQTMAWHPASDVLATDSAKGNGNVGSAVRLWSVAGNRMIFEYMTPGRETIGGLTFHPASGHLIWGEDGSLRVFEILGLP